MSSSDPSASAAPSAGSSARRVPRWLPLEADAELMTQYLHKLGADPSHQYAFHDVYGVDDEMLAMVPQPVLGVLLLFPISEASEAHKDSEAAEIAAKEGTADAQVVSPNLYYMKQTVGNACGTVGLTHAALNLASQLQLTPDTFFSKFLESTRTLTADERAVALEGNDDISEAHEAVASAGVTDATESMNTNLHFIALVPVDGYLYELDGRKQGPVNHGPTSADTVLKDAVKVVKQFMERDPDNVQFNMVALAPAQD